MIKDILVNLSYGTSQDGVSNYALSIAETFGAHIVGTAFAPVMASGVRLSANFIRAQQADAPTPPSGHTPLGGVMRFRVS